MKVEIRYEGKEEEKQNGLKENVGKMRQKQRGRVKIR